MSSARAPAPPPPFRAPAWLREHARSACLSFWARSPTPQRSGGHFHCLRDDGSVYDARTRHLVSSTRLAVQWAWALRHGLAPLPAPAPDYAALLASCLRFLRERHFVPATGGFRWVVVVEDDDDDAAAAAAGGAAAAAPSEAADDSNRSYGLCFALLAYSAALAAGVAEARALVDEVTATLTARFWEEEHGLYADEASADFAVRDRYRGQNANMHGW